MNVREELESKLKRFEELERLMALPETMDQSHKMAAYAREHGSLSKLANKFKHYKKLSTDIRDLSEMANSSDVDERTMAQEELTRVRSEREVLWNELLEMTIGGEDATRSRCVMEIRAGTGGEEAALFARDLFEMYKYNAESKGWKIEIMDASPSERGGFKEIILGFDGEGVYRELQFESGGHRVQRVPETETQGRIHTSAATVAVLAEPEDVEIDLKPDDYRIDKFCASGPAVSTSTKPNRPSGLLTTKAASWCSAKMKRANTRTWPKPSAFSRAGCTITSVRKRPRNAPTLAKRSPARVIAANEFAPIIFPRTA